MNVVFYCMQSVGYVLLTF